MAETLRYLSGRILADLDRKMVFVADPRQVGKTTLARSLPGAMEGYLNRDVTRHHYRRRNSAASYTGAAPGGRVLKRRCTHRYCSIPRAI